MRVMITGGTGFIGYHTARALLEAGHEVSLLVRSVDKMQELFGSGTIQHFTAGDIVEADRVREAMDGCDAVIHVAALVSTHARDAERVYETNLSGTKNVIGSAVDLGLERIIHVSSVTALYDPGAHLLDAHSPPGRSVTGYGRSKVACEKYVRGLQAAGEPVDITYPATVLGPESPGLTEPHLGLRTYLANFVPVMSSGNQYVDVRDLAQLHLRLLERRTGVNPSQPGRYLFGGHYIPWRELGPFLERLTGRKLLKLRLNARAMRLAGRLVDWVDRFVEMEVPLNAEAMEYATGWVQMDSGRVREDLALVPRPAEETFADTIRWLHRAGHITSEQAGTLSAD